MKTEIECILCQSQGFRIEVLDANNTRNDQHGLAPRKICLKLVRN